MNSSAFNLLKYQQAGFLHPSVRNMCSLVILWTIQSGDYAAFARMILDFLFLLLRYEPTSKIRKEGRVTAIFQPDFGGGIMAAGLSSEGLRHEPPEYHRSSGD